MAAQVVVGMLHWSVALAPELAVPWPLPLHCTTTGASQAMSGGVPSKSPCVVAQAPPEQEDAKHRPLCSPTQPVPSAWPSATHLPDAG